MDHNVKGAEDGLEHSGEDVVADSEVDGQSIGVGGDAEGWWHPRVALISELTLQSQVSRTSPMTKPFKLQCTPLLPWPAEVGVDLAAAELRLR